MVRLMKMSCAILIALAVTLIAQTNPRQTVRFSDSWKFYKGDATGADQVTFPDGTWQTVCLPHTVQLESAKTHGSYDYYHGYCWYRKTFYPDALWQGKKAFLEFEAGMQTTEVWVNGTKKTSCQYNF